MKLVARTVLAISGLGQSVVVENRAGAAGTIAGAAVARVGPAGLPRPIVARLNTEFAAALADPETRAIFAKWNIEPSPGTPEAFGAYVAQESARWREFVARSSLKLDL